MSGETTMSRVELAARRDVREPEEEPRFFVAGEQPVLATPATVTVVAAVSVVAGVARATVATQQAVNTAISVGTNVAANVG